MSPSPIALFVYNRPDHTRRTIEALRANPEAAASDLVVFSDGARNPAAQARVQEVRNLVADVAGFKSVRVVHRPNNFGLARSIISGVSELLEQYETVIVLEDDLVTSPFFLRYMNEALALYASDEEVASIHGYVYPTRLPLPETFFLRGADCWGWATWRRGWRHFRADGAALLRELKSQKLTRRFDFDGTSPYTKMLVNQIKGRNNSWAIRWHASAFLAGKLTLYPGRTLVTNIGTDATGTHFTGATSAFRNELTDRPVRLARLPLVESMRAFEAFKDYFRRLRWQLIRDRVLQVAETWLRRILTRGRTT